MPEQLFPELNEENARWYLGGILNIGAAIERALDAVEETEGEG